jgi:hypothetical protein
MKLARTLVALAVFFVSLLGCEMRQTHRDVSEKPEYRELIGATCELLVTLRAHGVTRKLEREKKTEYISIWNPGFSGPERTFVLSLAPGTHMRVLSARECSNCLFEALAEYQVTVVPEPAKFEGKPAFVRAASFTPQHVRCGSAP